MRPAQILNDARTRIVGIDVSTRKETTEKPCYFVTSRALNHGPRDLAPAPVPDGQNVIMSMTQICVRFLCGTCPMLLANNDKINIAL